MFEKRKKYENQLTVDDVVLLAMLHFPNGAVGESVIHEFVYELTDLEPYMMLRESLQFTGADNNHFSLVVHRSIINNCRDVTNVEQGSFASTGSTAAMFSDNLRFDLYDTINKKEEWMKDYVTNYSPKIYFLSAMGRAVAVLALQEKLTPDQKEVVKELASLYEGI